MTRRITAHEISIAEKLKHSGGVYARRMSEFMMMKQVGDIQLLRTLSDCIIELERNNEALVNDLVEAKKRALPDDFFQNGRKITFTVEEL